MRDLSTLTSADHRTISQPINDGWHGLISCGAKSHGRLGADSRSFRKYTAIPARLTRSKLPTAGVARLLFAEPNLPFGDHRTQSVAILAAPRPLVIDFHSESRFLLVRTLVRKFPGAEISECEEAGAAIAAIKRGGVDAVVTHRTFDVPGADLVRIFRACDPSLPIVMVSRADREEAAAVAGANRFLHYDEWLRIGSVVEELLGRRNSPFSADGQAELASSGG